MMKTEVPEFPHLDLLETTEAYSVSRLTTGSHK